MHTRFSRIAAFPRFRLLIRLMDKVRDVSRALRVSNLRRKYTRHPYSPRTKFIRPSIAALRAAARSNSERQTGSSNQDSPSISRQTNELDTCWDVLGLQATHLRSVTDIEKRYRELANLAHPDRGGSKEQMQELNWARAEARRQLQLRPRRS